MPRRRLPNLSTLPGFEAAARHLSFTLAAAELNLTQGAISRQVRELEAFLGRQLFRRFTRRIELTEDGVAYARVTRDILAELERATARFRGGAPSSRKVIVSIIVPQSRRVNPAHARLTLAHASATPFHPESSRNRGPGGYLN